MNVACFTQLDAVIGLVASRDVDTVRFTPSLGGLCIVAPSSNKK